MIRPIDRPAETNPDDPSDVAEGTVALTPERAFDMPAGPHTGHAASTVAPCSTGPASFDFSRGELSPDELMALEPTVDPLRQMEYGTEWTPEVRARVHELDRPIVKPPID